MAIGPDQPRPAAARPVRPGLRANWPQSTLLVLVLVVVVNVFADGMGGLERATTSLVGTRVFHLSGYLAVLSFIIAFAVTKALTNLAAGPLTARQTRKVLLAPAGPSACRSRSCSPGPQPGDGSWPRRKKPTSSAAGSTPANQPKAEHEKRTSNDRSPQQLPNARCGPVA